MGDPVSWLMIEPGWKVVASNGADVGTVHEVVGDTTVDIFDGLVVAPGLLRTQKYVSADRVRSISEGEVDLALTAEEFERLDEHDEQPPGAVRADQRDT